MAKAKPVKTQWQNRITGYGNQPASWFLANEDNWRIHPKPQADGLEGVLDTVGWVQDVIVNRRTSPEWGAAQNVATMVDGHLRVTLALRQGDDTPVPLKWVDLTPAEEALVLASLDPLGAMAATDKTKLDDLLRMVQSDDARVQAMIADLAEREGLEYGRAEPADDPGAEIDRAEELREKWGVELGQLWQLGEHRLICGDCTDRAVVERVMGGEKADFCITDPPYNVRVLDNNDDMSDTDFMEWCKSWTSFLPSEKILTVGIKKLLLWGEILGNPQWIISWVKMNGKGRTGLGGGNGKWDPILLYDVPQDFGIDVLEINNDYRGTLESGGFHLTGKPLDLWELLINRFGGQMSFDPFLGSGTTLIACERLGRHCRAIELEPKYVAVALERWATMTGQTPRLLDVS